ncbi:Glycosyltransferase [Fulvivirga imtechensis AK7]|uniref:Glycosyltransferase n=1 Tax=Fulvivirga imtechensis AK7 TaxID=1237149 RepID=L8JQN8_9BACT|nr:glycosyltransferase family 4 protein [Fulvivirga imtechensis]ELR71256.1 Glycosyltransferase [Fulvivirga imtechensis AK7]
MNILIASECFRPGGAQVFALRLARALSENTEYKVYVFYNFKDYISRDLVNKIYPKVRLLSPEIPFLLDFCIRKFDRLLRVMNIDIGVREKFVGWSIKKIISKYKIDIVHSHMFKSNYSFANALVGMDTPKLVNTMHGCYENFYNSYMTKQGEVLLNYPDKMLKTLQRLNGIAYLTEKNLEVINDLSPNLLRNKVVAKIYNGFPDTTVDQGLDDDTPDVTQRSGLVFGMVARGIAEKGWQIAIEAFLQIGGYEQHRLILVGSSDYLSWLKHKYAEHSNIIFTGHSDDPIKIIKNFDIGLLPSTFWAESLPNSVVEYLSCGKAVIATDIGEVKRMLNYEGFSAGQLLLIKQNSIEASDLKEKMDIYLQDRDLLAQHQRAALNVVKQFDMKICLDKYLKFYGRVVNERW